MIDLIQIVVELEDHCNVVYCEQHHTVPGLLTIELTAITNATAVNGILDTIKNEYSHTITEDIGEDYVIGRYGNSAFQSDLL